MTPANVSDSARAVQLLPEVVTGCGWLIPGHDEDLGLPQNAGHYEDISRRAEEVLVLS